MGQSKSKPAKVLTPNLGPTAEELDWAQRHGFNIPEFDAMIRVIHANQVKEASFQGSGTKIAEGEFGAVMLGTYENKKVAVKHITDKVAQSGTTLTELWFQSASQGGGFPELFRTVVLELSIIAELNHPNIVGFEGVTSHLPPASEDQRSFKLGMVFEMCADSMWAILHRNNTRFSWENKLRIIKEIAKGAAYLHSKQIVHRDLSSSNILFTNDNTAKIADFGFARKCNANGEYDSKNIAGTPGYMSTEQVAGAMLSPKTDVFALGCLLWELVTHKGSSRFPWNAKDPQRRGEIAMAVANDKATLVRDGQIPKGYEDGIVDTLRGAFHPNPHQRFSSSDFLSRLETVTNPTPTTRNQAMGKENAFGDFQITADGVLKQNRVALGVRQQNGAQMPAETPKARNQQEQELTMLLTAFYTKHNPTKLADVPYVVKVHSDKVDTLNAKLREQYQTDLTAFQKPPEKTKPKKVGCFG